jgi:imidazolonepropionase-like amidohydrolase
MRCILLALLLLPALAPACDQSPLLVRNVGVWSPEGVARHRDVYVADGRIQAVETTSRRHPPKGTRVIDGTGATMLPGFIDSHLHLGYGGQRARKPGDHPWGSAVVTGRQLLAAGVTSGRIHLSSLQDVQLLKDSQDPCAALPRLQAAGPAFIPGATVGYDSAVWTVQSPADAADRVMRIKNSGFEWIAIHEAHKFAPPELQAIVGTARAQGLRILASGYTESEVESSLALYPDTIDYISVSPEPEYPARLLEMARAQKELIWVARLGVHARVHAIQRDPTLLDDPLLYEFVPKDEVAEIRAAAAKEVLDRNTAHAKRLQAAYPTLRRKFQQLRESGITLAAGTDAGSPAHAHRDAIWWELRAWVEMGATPREALMAVTVNGAKLLDRNELARIAPGSVADFVVYRGVVEKGEFMPQHVGVVSKSGVLVR